MLTDDQIKDIAREADQYAQDATGDCAVECVRCPPDDKMKAKVKNAKKNGVSDLVGWMADELYNDANWYSDTVGDRVFDLLDQAGIRWGAPNHGEEKKRVWEAIFKIRSDLAPALKALRGL